MKPNPTFSPASQKRGAGELHSLVMDAGSVRQGNCGFGQIHGVGSTLQKIKNV
jgi:hypothetical protein